MLREGGRRSLIKPCLSATFSAISVTRIDLGSKTDLRGETVAQKRLSRGMTQLRCSTTAREMENGRWRERD